MSSLPDLESRVCEYLAVLCDRFPDRHVGGPGNAAACDFFAERAASLGWEVTRHPFECLDWEPGLARLSVQDVELILTPGPYSLPVDVSAPLSAASSVEDLENRQLTGHVLLLHGDLVREQLTPLHYPFYQWDSHTRILRALIAAKPGAIIAATGRNSELVGSLYPFPLIEDGDFDIPHTCIKDVEGEALLGKVGATAHVSITSRRSPSSAEQVIARMRGTGPGRVVVSGHIDSRRGTPGALDNATGASSLLLLAELLAAQGAPPRCTVELAPFNGEDDYAARGEVEFLALNEGTLEDIKVNVNLDGAGWKGHRVEVSTYGCSDELVATVRQALPPYPLLAEGEQWPQGDHMVFAMRNIPAIALTTSDASELRWTVAHTERDVPALVDSEQIAQAALFVRDLVNAV